METNTAASEIAMYLGVSAKMGVANRRAFVNVMMNVFRPFQNLRRESTFVCTCVSLETNAVEMKYGRIPRGNHVIPDLRILGSLMSAAEDSASGEG